MFDAYQKWLGIPAEQQPPTHYQLLGISVNEADHEVIKEAALRKTSEVRIYQSGPHAELCTRLLNEIAQARAVLLNPQSRLEYDVQLAGLTPAVEAGNADRNESSAVSSPTLPVPAASSQKLTPPMFEQILAAAAYGLLLLVGFSLTFCLTYRSVHNALQTEREADP